MLDIFTGIVGADRFADDSYDLTEITIESLQGENSGNVRIIVFADTDSYNEEDAGIVYNSDFLFTTYNDSIG